MAYQATSSVVLIRGHRIQVIAPDRPAPSPPTFRPTVEQIAKTLATLPDEELSNIQDVTIAPGPSVEHWIAVTSGSHVIYYEQPHSKSQADLDWALAHEGAHAYQAEHPDWEVEWERAMDADARGISYGKRGGPVEDFAESMVLYRLTKGTACEGTARAHYPKRYAILDRRFGAAWAPCRNKLIN